MSLGLDDLNKQKFPDGSKKKSSSEKKPANNDKRGRQAAGGGAWARSHTARPWSEKTLHSSVSSPRKKNKDANVSMNEEWLNIETSTPSWAEVVLETKTSRIEQKLSSIEARILKRLETPRRLLNLILGRSDSADR